MSNGKNIVSLLKNLHGEEIPTKHNFIKKVVQFGIPRKDFFVIEENTKKIVNLIVVNYNKYGLEIMKIKEFMKNWLPLGIYLCIIHLKDYELNYYFEDFIDRLIVEKECLKHEKKHLESKFKKWWRIWS